MTYLALVSAGEGRRAGFATVAGVALGLAVIGVAAALVQNSVTLYELLRWAGNRLPALPGLGGLDLGARTLSR